VAREDVYRFLLRMPEELRTRLTASAEESGRSLNREIVHRLEESLAEHDVPAATLRGRGEGLMLRKYRRPAFALGLVAAAAVLVAVVAGVSNPPLIWTKAPKLNADPDAASLKNRSLPGSLSREGSRRIVNDAAAEQVVDRAYPGKTIPFSYRRGAANAFSAASNRGPAIRGVDWQLSGPSIATYPAVLNRSNADYVASGRVTAMAIDPACTAGACRVWVAAAGGGVWRTDDGLAKTPAWQFVSGGFGTNAIGTLTFDAAHNVLYAGTGEPNASGDSEAGVGIYRSIDGGANWALVPGSPAISSGNSIASIAVAKDGTLYVGTTLGVRGVSGNSGGAVLDPNAPKVGLYKSTDSGLNFTLAYDDSASAAVNGWGVNHVEIDGHGDLYIAAEDEGIYRSKDAGATWQLVFAAQEHDGFGRTEFALNTVDPGNHTRIYVGDGGDQHTNPTPDGASFFSTSGVYRADNVDTTSASALTDGTANPGWTSLTTYDRTKPGYLTYDYCWAQCSYDNAVVSPAGNPNIVYVLGAYNYDFPARNNGRTVLLSTDGGTHWYDQTKDIPTDAGEQNGIHPDQHALVLNPSNPLQFFEGSDGGVVRSSGKLADGTADCDNRGLSTTSPSYTACRNALAQIPTHIDSLNAGLSTLQFGTVSVNPHNTQDIQGGTQDNGTWEGLAGVQSWPQTMYGDGGQSGFDVGNAAFRFNNFYLQYTDANFQNGDPEKWVVISAPFFASGEASAFYKPMIHDPVVSGTLYAGLQHVWRTKDNGGNQSDLENNCPEFTTAGNQPGCGDFVALGDPSGKGGAGTPGDLTAGDGVTDKSGGYVVNVARTPSDKSTMWVGTRRGRVFLSTNADAANPGDVKYTRLDTLSPVTPRRFVSGIAIDPANRYHAFVSFGGYNAATPDQPGHVFDVLYNPATGKATWSSLDRGTGPMGDLPVTSLAYDDATNRLYAATDFGVLTQIGKSGFWTSAADGLPMVEVSGLTLDQKSRTLYAATHGRAVWSLKLAARGGRG